MSRNKPPAANANTPSLSIEAISALLQKHREELSAEFKASLSGLENKLDQTKLITDDHDQRISSLELASEDFSQRIQEIEATCSSLREENDRLKAKVIDLENRSRRSNVRILGLAESTETGRPTEFFSQLLQEVLGKDVLPSPPEVDLAHRSLAPKPGPGQRARPVLLRMHRYRTKELLIREARRRGKLSYHGQEIRIVEDYSAEVMGQRAQYRDVMAGLYKLGFRPALLYPARLRVTLPGPGGVKKWINSVTEAQKFIGEHSLNQSEDHS